MNLRFGDLGNSLNDTDARGESQSFLEEWGDYYDNRERHTENYTESHAETDTHHHTEHESHSTQSRANPRDGIGAILSNLNKEDILLIALLYIMYEDGADKLTLLALAYILLG